MNIDRAYPIAPICAVGAIILKQDAVLLVQRGNAPGCGKWSIPGGAVHLGESLEDAVTREVREETQLRIRPIQIGKVVDRIYRDGSGRIQYHFVIVDYFCEVLEGEPHPSSDATAVGYFKMEELTNLDLTEGTAEVISEVYRNRLS
jgi:8-oxo-dGTP diphosphatase